MTDQPYIDPARAVAVNALGNDEGVTLVFLRDLLKPREIVDGNGNKAAAFDREYTASAAVMMSWVAIKGLRDVLNRQIDDRETATGQPIQSMSVNTGEKPMTRN